MEKLGRRSTMVLTILLVNMNHAGLVIAGSAAMPGQVLSYYVQLENGAAGLSLFLAPINASSSGPFGTGIIFALNLTQEASRDSKLIGFVRGFTLETSYLPSDAHGVEVAFIHYDDGQSKGTIQIQGEVLNADTEVAIVGGTGSFRGARGYLLISLVNVSEPFRVFFHELHFM